MKKSYTYIIYMTPKIKKFSGILGEIDFYTISLLLAGGKSIIEEEYEGNDPVGWYCASLEDQNMKVLKSKIQTIKGKQYIWIEIERDPSQISPLTGEETMDELIWKTFYYTCKSDTKEECLGLIVSAKEIVLNRDRKQPIYLTTLLDAII
jgi:hypothetical protein